MTRLGLGAALLATAAMAFVTFGTRAFPFLAFGKRKPGKAMALLEETLPPMIILILAVYAIAGSAGPGAKEAVAAASGVAATVLLHSWLRNSLVSIFCGTPVYMVAIAFLPF